MAGGRKDRTDRGGRRFQLWLGLTGFVTEGELRACRPSARSHEEPRLFDDVVCAVSDQMRIHSFDLGRDACDLLRSVVNPAQFPP